MDVKTNKKARQSSNSQRERAVFSFRAPVPALPHTLKSRDIRNNLDKSTEKKERQYQAKKITDAYS